MPPRFEPVTRSCAILALSLLLVAACRPSSPRLLSERMFAMATWVDLEIEPTGRAQGRALLTEIERLLNTAERDYYAWAPGGELAGLNAALAGGRPTTVSPALGDLLQRAQVLAATSHGHFDPGVGALVELWGFHVAPAPGWRPPPAQAIEGWRTRPASIRSLTLRDGQASSSDTRLRIDLGGIAKGYVLDRIVAVLREAGIANALVNAGGDLRVLGRRGDRPWHIGVRDPRGAGVLHTLTLQDGEAAFTSGDYERFVKQGSRRWHHILDPATGQPALHTAAVTVVAADGTTADAAATALLVAGPARWRALAKDLGIDFVLRVDIDGSTAMTAPMRARITAATPGSSAILVPAP